MHRGVSDLIRSWIFDTLVIRLALFVSQWIFVSVLFITCQPQIATGVSRENVVNSLCIWRFRGSYSKMPLCSYVFLWCSLDGIYSTVFTTNSLTLSLTLSTSFSPCLPLCLSISLCLSIHLSFYMCPCLSKPQSLSLSLYLSPCLSPWALSNECIARKI